MSGRFRMNDKVQSLFTSYIEQKISFQMCKQQQKTFVFEDELTHQSTITTQWIEMDSEPVDLKVLVQKHCPTYKYTISIYDPELMTYAQLLRCETEEGHIQARLLEPSFILIKFKQIDQKQENDVLSKKQTSLESSQYIKEPINIRSKQRTIGHIIELVRQWREIQRDHCGINGKRFSFDDAAKMFGVSKKTLDDYYCQLRQAEELGFNFADNLMSKCGVMRMLIKQNQKNGQKKSDKRTIKKENYRKHPVELKILSQFDNLVNNFFNPQQKENKQILLSPTQTPFFTDATIQQNYKKPQQLQSSSFFAEKQEPCELFEIQNTFFKSMEEPYNNKIRSILFNTGVSVSQGYSF